MKTSATVWYCNYCGESFYTQPEAVGHSLRAHKPRDGKPRVYGKCADCGAWLTGIETTTHHCAQAERRRASAGWWPLVVAVVIVAIIAWIIGRIMV